MSLRFPKSLPLANLPTPIQRLNHFSKAWGGPEIYIKRDDLTGCAVSGNKIRKLAFVAADAKAKGADTLITCGGIQSNHARATALVAAMLGMHSVLVLRGQEPQTVQGNLLLDKLAGADIQWVSEEEYEMVNERMVDIRRSLERKGHRPYVIPEGASYDLGYWGYVHAAQEIAGQLDIMQLTMDYIVTATGSGGTLGGLILGTHLLGLNTMPVGINVCRTAEHFQSRIHGVLHGMIHDRHWPIDIGREDITVIDGYVGKGYAQASEEVLWIIAEVARMEGIVLDPVYTGKAMFAIQEEIRAGRFKKGQKILFIHTGGIFGLFPQARELAAVVAG